MYKSPIEIIYGQMETQIEGDVLRTIQSYGINADKERLIQALQYDSNQYFSGYRDAISDHNLVNVVRCKDCKFFIQDDPTECTKWRRKGRVVYTTPDGYCHKGERNCP